MGVMCMKVKIGCCGFPVSRRKYYSVLSTVEVQQTFYKLPTESTVRRWREEAPKDFEFTVKAWQIITHHPRSPTWRKAGISIDPSEQKYYGLLKPTKQNFEAWEMFMNIVKILNSRVVIVQTPPYLSYSQENFRNVLRFFSYVKSRYPDYIIGWEPRGTWKENIDKIKEIVGRTKILHVVDPFKMKPVLLNTDTCYFRLHGIGPREVNYRYKYTKEDFRKLVDILEDIMEDGVTLCYVMFNNIYMFNDALEFKEYLKKYTDFEVL